MKSSVSLIFHDQIHWADARGARSLDSEVAMKTVSGNLNNDIIPKKQLLYLCYPLQLIA